MSKLYSTEEIAQKLGVTRQWIGKLVNRGDIEGQKVGGKWVISEEAIKAYKAAKAAEDKSK